MSFEYTEIIEVERNGYIPQAQMTLLGEGKLLGRI